MSVWMGRGAHAAEADMLGQLSDLLNETTWRLLGYACSGFVLLIIAYWTGITVRKIFQRRREVVRRRHHLCRKCGYDLRASTDRWPECGEWTAIKDTLD